MSFDLIDLLSNYGIAALFIIMTLSAIGIPFPSSLTLLATGSFVAQGELALLPVIVVCSIGAIIGDNIGYGVGLWGGRPMIDRMTKRFGGADKIKSAENYSRKWAGPGIFFSRWLVGALGPWINISTGSIAYPWKWFLLWGISGEILWVVLYVSLGLIFSDQVVVISNFLGDLSWALAGLLVTACIGWKLFAKPKITPLDNND